MVSVGISARWESNGSESDSVLLSRESQFTTVQGAWNSAHRDTTEVSWQEFTWFKQDVEADFEMCYLKMFLWWSNWSVNRRRTKPSRDLVQRIHIFSKLIRVVVLKLKQRWVSTAIGHAEYPWACQGYAFPFQNTSKASWNRERAHSHRNSLLDIIAYLAWTTRSYEQHSHLF